MSPDQPYATPGDDVGQGSGVVGDVPAPHLENIHPLLIVGLDAERCGRLAQTLVGLRATWAGPPAQSLRANLERYRTPARSPDVVLLLYPPEVPVESALGTVRRMMELERLTRGCHRFVAAPGAIESSDLCERLLAWIPSVPNPGVSDDVTADASVRTEIERILSSESGPDPERRSLFQAISGLADAIRTHDAGASEWLASLEHLLALQTPDTLSRASAPAPSADLQLGDCLATRRNVADLFERLDAATQTIFESMTWRLGNAFAELGRIGLRLPPNSVRDQVDALRAHFHAARSAWEHDIDLVRSNAFEASTRDGQDSRLRVAALIGRSLDGTPVASAYIRLVLPLTHPSAQGDILLRVIDLDEIDKPWPQVLIVQRAAVPDPAKARRIVRTCRSRGIRLVLEIDDDLFALPRRLHRPEGYSCQTLAALRIIATMANQVVVSTDALKSRLLRYNRVVDVVPNALDEILWLERHRNGFHPPRMTPGSEPIRILYMGTRTHGRDLRIIGDAVRRLRAHYGHRIDFELIGGLPGGQHTLEALFSVVDEPPSKSYPDFVAWLREHHRWSIGIIPLEDTAFNRSKSDLKLLDYSALGLASVCSDAESYRRIARHEVNAILVENSSDAWYGALARLIDDPSLRERIAENAFRDITAGHLLATQARGYADALLDFGQSGLESMHLRRDRTEAPFSEVDYLRRNPDVAALVARGRYASGREHWERIGRVEAALGDPSRRI